MVNLSCISVTSALVITVALIANMLSLALNRWGQFRSGGSDVRFIFTTRKRSLGQGNIFISICHSVPGWGGGFPTCITGHMTRGVCIQEVCISGLVCFQGVCIQGVCIQGGWAEPPSEIHGILWDTVNKRAVRILVECFLVSIIFKIFLDFSLQ